MLFLMAVACGTQYIAPVEDTAEHDSWRIYKGATGWAKVQGSWDSGLMECLFCENIASGSVQTMEMGGCQFQMRVTNCTCVGDDPGENTMGLELGCYCEGVVTQINYNPNGACADADLLGDI